MRRKNIGIVLGSFHRKEVAIMLDEARATAARLGMTIVSEIWVPGSFEKPLVTKRLLQNDAIDGAVVLGIIERGETKHGLVMGQAVSTALVQLQLELMKPVGLGILGPEILPDQIPPRLRGYADAAVTAVDTILDLPIW